MTRLLIRCDGTTETLPAPVTSAEVEKLIGAEYLDVVSLRHMGEPLHVMFVDDLGHEHRKPVNVEATRLYHLNCYAPQGTHAHAIVGDVVVCPDEDYS